MVCSVCSSMQYSQFVELCIHDKHEVHTLYIYTYIRIYGECVQHIDMKVRRCICARACVCVFVFKYHSGEPVTVSFEDFMHMVLDCRGGQSASVKDIMTLGKRVNGRWFSG